LIRHRSFNREGPSDRLAATGTAIIPGQPELGDAADNADDEVRNPFHRLERSHHRGIDQILIVRWNLGRDDRMIKSVNENARREAGLIAKSKRARSGIVIRKIAMYARLEKRDCAQPDDNEDVLNPEIREREKHRED
jgi:hypothetical protein